MILKNTLSIVIALFLIQTINAQSNDSLTFTSYRKPNKTITLDTTTLYSITLSNNDNWEYGYVWGKLAKADSNFLYLRTDKIYPNCYFSDIEYQKIGKNSFLAKLDRNYTIDLSWPKKHKTLNSVSETMGWISAATVLLSPIVCINYKDWTFNENRYFAINKIALPTLATSITVYLLTDFKSIKLSGKPLNEKRTYH